MAVHLIFEEQPYLTKDLERLCLQKFLHQLNATYSKCNHIGFHKNYQSNISVFVLPKIFLHDQKVFGKYDYKLFVSKTIKGILSLQEFEIIKSITEKLYFCLRKYQREINSNIIDRELGFSIKSNIGIQNSGAFEAMLALIAFNRNNPLLYTQERQILESKTSHTINWKKTLSASIPVSVDDSLIYLDFSRSTKGSKKDDLLLVIFYSLLNNFRDYDSTINIRSLVKILNPNQLIKIKPKIKNFLRTSKSTYFSDKFRQLHSLLQSYYFAENAAYSSEQIEFLLTNDFEILFERFVDSLISDEHLLKLYKFLKDGKEIDHLFGEKDVFKGCKIIYIGDSKYYKDPAKIASQKYKQFTYSRNIIQENIYIVNNGENTIYSRNYRDSVSEGYNVTPNFFVFAVVQSSYLEANTLISIDSQAAEFSFHFENRLFDRDSLHILYFKIDFIGLLNFYVGTDKRLGVSHSTLKRTSKNTIQTEFRQYLDRRYMFCFVEISQDSIEGNFKALHGKIFTSPAIFPKYILALDKRFELENQEVLSLLSAINLDIFQVNLTDLSEI